MARASIDGNRGAPYIHLGAPNIHLGAPNIHLGAPNIHIGAPNIRTSWEIRTDTNDDYGAKGRGCNSPTGGYHSPMGGYNSPMHWRWAFALRIVTDMYRQRTIRTTLELTEEPYPEGIRIVNNIVFDPRHISYLRDTRARVGAFGESFPPPIT
eukprot:1180011-Prorocentrum_minimum.AAC.1